MRSAAKPSGRQARSLIPATIQAEVKLFLAGCLLWAVAANPVLGEVGHFTATNLLSLRQTLKSAPGAAASILIEGTICEVSPREGLLIIQDASGTDLLKLATLPDSLGAGDRVRLTATNCLARWQRQGLTFASASPVQIEMLSSGLRPTPTPLEIGRPLEGTSNLWATIHAQVSFAGATDRGLWLELRLAKNALLHLELINQLDLPPELLLKSRLRVTGLAMPVTTTAEQPSLGMVTLAGGNTIQIIDFAPEAWNAYPLHPVAETVAQPYKGSRVVRLAGWLRRAGAGERSRLELGDGDTRVALNDHRTSTALIDSFVEALGVLHHSSGGFSLSSYCLRPGSAQTNAGAFGLLTSAEQVLRLNRQEASRRYPVRLRGVVTSVLPGDCRNFVLQDASHGIFIYATNPATGQCPQPGEFWEVQGVSGPGAFSPFVLASRLALLGAGQMPEPIRPAWDQLINGSLDNHYVEIEGIITRIDAKSLQLLTHWGQIAVTIFGRDMKELAVYQDKLVRLRGCLKALWDGATHQLKFGAIRLDDVIVGVDQAVPGDPFSLPIKPANQLKLFDYHAGVFRRVHVAGQIVGKWQGEYFLVDGVTGLRFVSEEANGLNLGDHVQVVGYPELGRPAPLLHETVVRRTGTGPLPAPRRLSAGTLLQVTNDSTRVQIEGVLGNLQVGGREMILEMRCEVQPFLARLPTVVGKRVSWEPGSRLRLTGVYAGQGPGSLEGDLLAGFELLLDSPRDVEVLAQPPWWTFRRLLVAVGALGGVLVLASVWILLLRRQVERRTRQLESANRQREQAERARVLDEERLRIARDLHDDLGSSLTEITMLGSMGLNESKETRADYITQIMKKARASVNALDAIVWAVNPRENTLQSLADYLAGYADEFLHSSGIAHRILMPVSFPPITLEGRTRHELFLAVKEALNNAVRHAQPTEVELAVALEGNELAMTVRDNGIGFDPTTKNATHGLGNMRGRLEKLGGQCRIESAAGQGTVVNLRLPLPGALADTAFAV